MNYTNGSGQKTTAAVSSLKCILVMSTCQPHVEEPRRSGEWEITGTHHPPALARLSGHAAQDLGIGRHE